MIKLHIVAVGKIKESFYREAISEYIKRISRYASLDIVEVPDVPDDGASAASSQQKAEADGILKRLRGYVVLLDLDGKMITSEELAHTIANTAANGESEFSFVIGGSRGVSPEIKAAAHLSVAFGRVTYPHQLMRVIVAEQLYRAISIINNTSYHK